MRGLGKEKKTCWGLRGAQTALGKGWGLLEWIINAHLLQAQEMEHVGYAHLILTYILRLTLKKRKIRQETEQQKSVMESDQEPMMSLLQFAWLFHCAITLSSGDQCVCVCR